MFTIEPQLLVQSFLSGSQHVPSRGVCCLAITSPEHRCYDRLLRFGSILDYSNLFNYVNCVDQQLERHLLQQY
jgi:hypothetical protein